MTTGDSSRSSTATCATSGRGWANRPADVDGRFGLTFQDHAFAGRGRSCAPQGAPRVAFISFTANISAASRRAFLISVSRTMPNTLEMPTPEDVREAQTALRRLAPLASPTRRRPDVLLRAEGEDPGQAVVVPRHAFELFLEILGQMANGNAVTILPV